jgi:hypothetical protein
MNYLPPTKFINYKDYDAMVSIGNKCATVIALREQLDIYKQSFPFDYVPTTPYLILKYLQNQNDFYPKKNICITSDNVWFGHFDINEKYDETIETFRRRFKRLFNLLENKKKILFVYTSEADVYNQMNIRYNDNYNQLCKIVEYLIETYKYDNFKLLCIHTNKSFADTNNIINFTINVPDIYISDNMSTHTEEIYNEYRNLLKYLFKDIFQIKV